MFSTVIKGTLFNKHILLTQRISVDGTYHQKINIFVSKVPADQLFEYGDTEKQLLPMSDVFLYTAFIVALPV